MISRRLSTPLQSLLLALCLFGCSPFSDDFNTCVVDEAGWTFVDPRGDSSFQVVGGGSGDAKLEISVPAGISHDPWGTNQSARLMQPILDPSEFKVRAKFDSPVAGVHQIQGLLVEASPTHWIRFDVFSNAGGTRLFAGTHLGGSGTQRLNKGITSEFPLYLELRRAGNQWTASHSTDGESWVVDVSFTHAMEAKSIGVFAGNDGSDPAHTAVIDYFWSESWPFEEEEDAGAVPDGSALDVHVYGGGSVIQDPMPPAGGYACGANVSLTAQPDPGWVFSSWSSPATASQNPLNLTLVSPRWVAAWFEQITTPPTIQDIAIEASESTATVSWTTNHPSTSSVVWGETTSYELGSIDDPTRVQSHTLTLTGLTSGTTHHLRISSENEAGLTASSDDQSFVTLSLPPSGGIVSDDFNVCALEPGTWTFVDPLLDASYSLVGGGTGDAQVQIVVPAGSEHNPYDTNRSPRLIQSVPDGDFDVLAKFDSPVIQQYQIQGLVAEQSSIDFVRFDVFSDGNQTRLYGGVNVAGSGQTRFNVQIPSTFPIILRLRREGSQWTASHSFDGVIYTVDGSFTHVMALNAIGVQAGNSGADPAHTAVIDWFVASVSPLVDEDGASLPAENVLSVSALGSGSVSVDPEQPLYVCGASVTLEAVPGAGSWFTGWSGDLGGAQNPDALVMNEDRDVTASFAPIEGPPTISGLQVVAVTESTAVIQWSTNHPATSRVDYGTTNAYELGSEADPALVSQHSVVLSGLTPNTPHHFRVSSTNELSLAATSGDQVFITRPSGGPGGPLIQVWYGEQQAVGSVGMAQPFFNVLGNVLDADGVASLAYSLNGGPSLPANIGPDDRRLADPGDFNIEIPIASMTSGINTVGITATDSIGESTARTVVVDLATGQVWPLNYVIDWNQVSNVQDVAQVIDGRWEVAGGLLRTLQVDYDRLVALGDITWADYEAVVPITIHGFDPAGFSQFSNRPGVGVLLRWVRHLPPGQPQHNFDLGAIGMYRIGQTGVTRLEMWTEDSTTSPAVQRALAFDVPYLFKMQVETFATNYQYRLKVWEQGQPEPPGWDLVEDQPLSAPASGSVVLVAHHVDASFGTITVTPLP